MRVAPLGHAAQSGIPRTGPGLGRAPEQAYLARSEGPKNVLVLLAIKLDDQLFIDWDVNLAAFRNLRQAALVGVAVDVHPRRRRLMAVEFLGHLQARHLATAFAHGNFLSHADLEGRNVHLASVDGDVPVTHELPGLPAGHGKTHAVDDVVQAPFELLQEHLAGDTPGLRSLFEVVAELAFLHEEHALGFLFFTQLQAIAHNLRLLVFSVLARRKVALFDGALLAKTLCALEEQLHAFATAKTAYSISITCQVRLLEISNAKTGLQDWRHFFPVQQLWFNS